MKIRYPTILALLCILVLSAAAFSAGCAGSAPTTPAPATPVPSASAAPAPQMTTPATGAATPVTGTPAPSVSGAAATIENFAFSPATLTVKAGTTVTWTNRDSAPHTVTSDAGAFGSDTMPRGGTYQFTFSQPGTFTYHCSIHPSMKGTVIVQA
jgi:plastocyanin